MLSITSKSFSDKPVLSKSFFTAIIGPIPITSGLTPECEYPNIFALTFNPFDFAAAVVLRTNAAAPSFKPDELPAVTVPFSIKTEFKPLRLSASVSFGCSSTLNIFFLTLISTI